MRKHFITCIHICAQKQLTKNTWQLLRECAVYLEVQGVEDLAYKNQGAEDDLEGLWVSCMGLGKLHCSLKTSMTNMELTLEVLVTTIDALGTFKQDKYTTVGGNGGCRVGEVRADTTPPCPTIRVLSYSNCQRSTHSIANWVFQKFSTSGVKITTGT